MHQLATVIIKVLIFKRHIISMLQTEYNWNRNNYRHGIHLHSIGGLICISIIVHEKTQLKIFQFDKGIFILWPSLELFDQQHTRQQFTQYKPFVLSVYLSMLHCCLKANNLHNPINVIICVISVACFSL